MAWVRISDDFYDHPKMAGLSPMALGYWITALAWCNRNLTDGAIPRPVAGRLVDFRGVAWGESDDDVDAGHAEGYTWLTCANELTAAGVLAETDGGYAVVDYLDYQPSAATVKAERQKNAQRQQEWRERNKGRNGVTNGGVTGAPNPNPNPKQKTPAATAAEADPAFAEFWSNYPRKVGKAAAAKAFAKAIGPNTSRQKILDGLARAVAAWTAAGTELRFIPHPATWLNQGRWDDDLETPVAAAPPVRGGDLFGNFAAARAANGGNQ